MARENLTKGRIDEFESTPLPDGVNQVFLWDGKASQLAVRKTAGAVAYIFQSRLHGKTLRMTIGGIDNWTIPDARKEATRLQGLIDQGTDPREVKQEKQKAAEAKRIEVARGDVRVRDAWAAYIEARTPKWSARNLADHINLADAGGKKKKRGKGLTKAGVLAPLMPLKMSQIDAKRVKAWLTKEAATRATQSRLAFNLFRAFANWCELAPEYQGIIPADALSSTIAKDCLPKARAKTDSLQREQLPAWFAAVRQINSQTVAAYLQCLLLTGARRESLALLKWADVDFRWNSITIRDKEESKGGEDGTRTIPLTPFVKSLLLDLKARNETPPPKWRILHGKKIENDAGEWKPSPWVFSSKTGSEKRLTDPTSRHYKACEIAGIEGLSLHGLRRSFANLAEWLEIPAGIVAQIMGHKPSATAEKHYRVRPLDLLRVWHTKLEAWILEQAQIPFHAEENKLQVAA